MMMVLRLLQCDCRPPHCPAGDDGRSQERTNGGVGVVGLVAVYYEQLDQWRSGSLTVAQRREVERLRGQLAHNYDVDAAILSLADNLKATTIDAILAKSDLELGLEVSNDRSLLFPRDLPRRPQP
jgi:hypothetical protein